jgi:acrylyl-CoA reductase (NADPH)
MSSVRFKALLLEEADGAVRSEIRELSADALPEGDVLVRVAYSDLNYKDGLAVRGKGRVVRTYPMVPGIDFAGTVEESESPEFRSGDKIIATGWRLGEAHWGGYAQLARVPGDWLVPLPDGMTLEEAMGIGTAGLTAMLSVMALEERGLQPGGRPLIVTGATGGVGSIAVALLARLGYEVAAATGKREAHAYLEGLGAKEIVDRNELIAGASKPLMSERWDGAVDTVGGATLAAILPAMAYWTSVAVCGNAGGAELHTTVLPFILRGVSLLGIDSRLCSRERRMRAWTRLNDELPRDLLARMIEVVALADVPSRSDEILQGQIRGRVVVDVNR